MPHPKMRNTAYDFCNPENKLMISCRISAAVESKCETGSMMTHPDVCGPQRSTTGTGLSSWQHGTAAAEQWIISYMLVYTRSVMQLQISFIPALTIVSIVRHHCRVEV